MNIATMRLVDRWLGVPLCAGLTVGRRLRDLFPQREAGPVRRIAFLKLAEQGSTVLASSAFRRAVEMVGRDNVYFLAFEENRFILDVMDLIPCENVITIRTGGIGGTLVRTLAAVREMRRRRIDAVIDLEFFARSSAALSYMSGASRRVGFHPWQGEGPYRGDLLTHRLRYNPHLHTAQTFRTMVEALAVPAENLPTFDLAVPPADDAPPPFVPGEDESAATRRIVADAAGTDDFEPLILLNANCSDILPLRAWPAERYVELARRVLAAFPAARVAFTGAPPEADAVLELVARIDSPRCFNLAGRTTLRELLIVYGLAEVMVTNDSGPAHFATLTPIDVITLFGPEHPALFAARSPRNHVLFADLACSPCVSAQNNRTTPCRDNRCLQAIEVDTVFDRVRGALADRGFAARDRRLPVVEVVAPDPAQRPAARPS